MKRKRRKTRKELKKQRKITIISIITIPLLLTIGYSAFQTNISINTKGKVKYYELGKKWNYEYKGTYQVFKAPYTGEYKIELWGAGGITSTGKLTSKGGYTSGIIRLLKEEKLYVYVGQHGIVTNDAQDGAWNGGGASGRYSLPTGGGATDVRFFPISPTSSDLEWNSDLGLNSRIMVAGAEGGTYGSYLSGAAGGLKGYASTGRITYEKVATQTEPGGEVRHVITPHWIGHFGIGGSTHDCCEASGGGGYYGGGLCDDNGGGGGSSYISGHTGCVAITSSTDRTPKNGCETGTLDNACSIHYSQKIFTSTKMIDGEGFKWTNKIENEEAMPNPNTGYYDLKTGHQGNGYAKITLISHE